MSYGTARGDQADLALRLMRKNPEVSRFTNEIRRKLFQLREMNNLTETCRRYVDEHPDLTNEPSVLVPISVLYLHIFVLGIFGNLAVLYLTMRNRQLQTVQNIFILNLAASDVLMCLTSLPITLITNVYKTWLFASPVCKLLPLVQGASIFVSTFSLAAIALDRYNLVVRPHRIPLTSRGASMVALSLWVISVVVCMPYGWYMDVIKIPGLCGVFCTEKWPLAEVRKGYAFMVLITQFLFPFTTMAFCYYAIFSRLQHRAEKKLKKISERTQLLENSTTAAVVNTVVQDVSKTHSASEGNQRILVLAQQRRTTTILASMVLFFGLTWLPHNVVTLMIEYDEFFFHTNEGVDHTYMISTSVHLISMLNNVSNPFLYAWLNPVFREILLKTIKGSNSKSSLKQNTILKVYEFRDVDGHDFVGAKNRYALKNSGVPKNYAHLQIGLLQPPMRQLFLLLLLAASLAFVLAQTFSCAPRCQCYADPEHPSYMHLVCKWDQLNTTNLNSLPRPDLVRTLTIRCPHQYRKPSTPHAGMFQGLQNLERLELDRCQISYLPEALFAGLGQLYSLIVRNANMTDIPRELFAHVPNLMTLDLSGNKLRIEPYSLRYLSNLVHLDLSENDIAFLTNTLIPLTMLRVVTIDRNKITNIDFRRLPEELTDLSLRNNWISTIHYVPNSARHLRRLDLAGNRLEFFAGAGSSAYINVLPASLRFVDLSSNKINFLHESAMQHMQKMAVLDLQNNSLREVKMENLLGSKVSLRVYLSKNPLRCHCNIRWMLHATEKLSPTVADVSTVTCESIVDPSRVSLLTLADARNELLCKYKNICEAECPCCSAVECPCRRDCPPPCQCLRSANTASTKVCLQKCF
ncbi:unnamed protein product [Caenorhabditis auriculariae]|uniref:G-protein coupled receptors family 1 profile domain-containing protein n=1 Tax=Caenorhabditis auriculariae TaxID=2777116 RepID=A0A8S1H6J6_9PELO|nr:unnamed protein product [Caenorhabditis auriculariae]